MNDKNDLALLILRAPLGALLAGHGAQKLFGWFGGHGFAGTAKWLESMELRPGEAWAVAAGASELGGGLLTMLGLLHPLGPIAAISAMAMATVKGHWGKPIWVTSGGAELPVTNIAIAAALLAAGPGRYSLDRALGLRLPAWADTVAALAALAGVAAGVAGVGAERAAPEPAAQAT